MLRITESHNCICSFSPKPMDGDTWMIASSLRICPKSKSFEPRLSPLVAVFEGMFLCFCHVQSPEHQGLEWSRLPHQFLCKSDAEGVRLSF